MKILLPTLLLLLLPSLAMAHGGHAAAGAFHAWLHLLYALLPALLVGVGVLAFRARRARVRGPGRR